MNLISARRPRGLSDHPLAPGPEARLQHLLVDLADPGHRQLRDGYSTSGVTEVLPVDDLVARTIAEYRAAMQASDPPA
jgi:hypothetical protein